MSSPKYTSKTRSLQYRPYLSKMVSLTNPQTLFMLHPDSYVRLDLLVEKLMAFMQGESGGQVVHVHGANAGDIERLFQGVVRQANMRTPGLMRVTDPKSGPQLRDSRDLRQQRLPRSHPASVQFVQRSVSAAVSLIAGVAIMNSPDRLLFSNLITQFLMLLMSGVSAGVSGYLSMGTDPLSGEHIYHRSAAGPVVVHERPEDLKKLFVEGRKSVIMLVGDGTQAMLLQQYSDESPPAVSMINSAALNALVKGYEGLHVENRPMIVSFSPLISSPLVTAGKLTPTHHDRNSRRHAVFACNGVVHASEIFTVRGGDVELYADDVRKTDVIPSVSSRLKQALVQAVPTGKIARNPGDALSLDDDAALELCRPVGRWCDLFGMPGSDQSQPLIDNLPDTGSNPGMNQLVLFGHPIHQRVIALLSESWACRSRNAPISKEDVRAAWRQVLEELSPQQRVALGQDVQALLLAEAERVDKLGLSPVYDAGIKKSFPPLSDEQPLELNRVPSNKSEIDEHFFTTLKESLDTFMSDCPKFLKAFEGKLLKGDSDSIGIVQVQTTELWDSMKMSAIDRIVEKMPAFQAVGSMKHVYEAALFFALAQERYPDKSAAEIFEGETGVAKTEMFRMTRSVLQQWRESKLIDPSESFGLNRRGDDVEPFIRSEDADALDSAWGGAMQMFVLILPLLIVSGVDVVMFFTAMIDGPDGRGLEGDGLLSQIAGVIFTLCFSAGIHGANYIAFDRQREVPRVLGTSPRVYSLGSKPGFTEIDGTTTVADMEGETLQHPPTGNPQDAYGMPIAAGPDAFVLPEQLSLDTRDWLAHAIRNGSFRSGSGEYFPVARRFFVQSNQPSGSLTENVVPAPLLDAWNSPTCVLHHQSVGSQKQPNYGQWLDSGFDSVRFDTIGQNSKLIRDNFTRIQWLVMLKKMAPKDLVLTDEALLYMKNLFGFSVKGDFFNPKFLEAVLAKARKTSVSSGRVEATAEHIYLAVKDLLDSESTAHLDCPEYINKKWYTYFTPPRVE